MVTLATQNIYVYRSNCESIVKPIEIFATIVTTTD